LEEVTNVPGERDDGWTTMMVAMMFPAVAPIVLMHRLVTRRRGEGLAPTFAFGAAYLVVWSLVGLVPLAVLIGFRQVTHDSAWLDRAGGLVLLLAGLYQFSRWKTTCLRACRTPLSFLLTQDFGGGLAGAFRVGLSHGLYCLGCCWALMAVLFTVGSDEPGLDGWHRPGLPGREELAARRGPDPAHRHRDSALRHRGAHPPLAPGHGGPVQGLAADADERVSVASGRA
jgi:hypothetical protein